MLCTFLLQVIRLLLKPLCAVCYIPVPLVVEEVAGRCLSLHLFSSVQLRVVLLHTEFVSLCFIMVMYAKFSCCHMVD
jgi:hypothetical protein